MRTLPDMPGWYRVKIDKEWVFTKVVRDGTGLIARLVEGDTGVEWWPVDRECFQEWNDKVYSTPGELDFRLMELLSSSYTKDAEETFRTIHLFLVTLSVKEKQKVIRLSYSYSGDPEDKAFLVFDCSGVSREKFETWTLSRDEDGHQN